MTFDNDKLERAYPYRSGWRVAGCTALLFGVLGFIGTVLVPVGCDKLRANQLPLGIALTMIGVCTAPMLLLALGAIVMGIRETINPPLMRVSTTSLLLPANLRENSTAEDEDEREEPKNFNQPLVQPAEIPFKAIRWIRREGPHNPGNDKLLIVHDLSTQTLVIEQPMMDTGDFDELEMVLRAAVPQAFTSAPPTSQ